MPARTRNNAVREYQNRVFEILRSKFGDENVEKEWNVAKNSEDDFTRELYCPRLDIAVGTFNKHRNVHQDNLRISEIINNNRRLIEKLWHASELKIIDFNDFMDNKNKNPRCALALEIENSGSSKHMLGNIVNVSILGAIGIVVPFNDKKLALCKRIKKYVAFATEVEKIKDVFKNVMIISKNNFLRAVNDSL